MMDKATAYKLDSLEDDHPEGTATATQSMQACILGARGAFSCQNLHIFTYTSEIPLSLDISHNTYIKI